jgi:hypothetical protein
LKNSAKYIVWTLEKVTGLQIALTLQVQEVAMECLSITLPFMTVPACLLWFATVAFSFHDSSLILSLKIRYKLPNIHYHCGHRGCNQFFNKQILTGVGKYYLPDHLIDIIHLVCIWHSDQLGLLG